MSIIAYAHGGQTYICGELASASVSLMDADGTLHKAGHSLVFDHQMAPGDRLVVQKRVESAVSYEPSRGSLRKLTAEQWESLPSSIKSDYTKVVNHELVMVDVEFELVDVAAETAGAPGFHVMDADKLVQRLVSDPGVGKSVSFGRTYVRNRKVAMEAYFHSEPWDGKMKKVYQTKSNGRPYADRRFNLVKDMPECIAKLRISNEEIPVLYADTVEALENKFDGLVKAFEEKR